MMTYYIDARHFGNILRYIPESSEGNCQVHYIYDDEIWKLIYVSVEKIKKGDPL